MLTKSLTNPGESLLAFEIAQQPVLWPTTLEHVASARFDHLLKNSPVILTGAGTSAYAASAIAEAWPEARAIPTTDLLLQSVTALRLELPALTSGGLLISLARSGDSPESRAVVEKIQRWFPSVQHLAIVCNADGQLAHLPGVHVITLDPRTNDRSLAMTGSFTNLVLGGLCLTQGRALAQALPAICDQLTGSLQELNTVAEQIASVCRDRIVILSSAMQALAKEAALKIIELTAGSVMAMSETFLGFRHGAVGFLREDTPVLCFLSSDPQKRLYEEDMLEDLRGKGLGRLIVVGNHVTSQSGRHWQVLSAAWNLPDALRTPFEMVFAQLLAFHLSVHANVDPDNPSPDGAITRVVRPFRIHQEADAS